MSDLSDVLPLIYEKTKEKKLKWDQLSNTTFVSQLGSLILEVSETRNDNVFVLRTDNGQTLERLTFQDAVPPLDDLIQNIYELARINALEIEERIDDLKGILKNL